MVVPQNIDGLEYGTSFCKWMNLGVPPFMETSIYINISYISVWVTLSNRPVIGGRLVSLFGQWTWHLQICVKATPQPIGGHPPKGHVHCEYIASNFVRDLYYAKSVCTITRTNLIYTVYCLILSYDIILYFCVGLYYILNYLTIDDIKFYYVI